MRSLILSLPSWNMKVNAIRAMKFSRRAIELELKAKGGSDPTATQ
jgi:hypothetical protein